MDEVVTEVSQETEAQVSEVENDKSIGQKKESRSKRLKRKIKARMMNQKAPIKEYLPIVKDNENFVKYYKSQPFFENDQEFEAFIESCRTTLPASFRINAFDLSQAKFLRNLVEGPEFKKFSIPNSEPEDKTTTKDGQDDPAKSVSPILQPLCWYPQRFGWQMNITRLDLKKTEILQDLHKFIMAETDNGFISRQEAVSMIPPLLLDVHRGQSILDMCAAPGSKTAQLLEYLAQDVMKNGQNAKFASNIPFDDGMVVANDVDNKRCYMLVHQASRLNSPNCIIINQDASRLPNIKTSSIVNNEAGDGKLSNLKFDRILCDVPCTGDGTLRKNPDVWRKWTVGNANNFHGLQSKILRRGIELLNKDGLLVYSTCSMNPIEDEAVVSSLLRAAEGTVQLEEVSNKVPGLKFKPGISQWVTMGKEVKPIKCLDEVPAAEVTHIYPSLFQPTEGEAKKFNLHRCLRILPHLQNTGAFFVAVLRKLTDRLPWESVETIEEPITQVPINPKKRRYKGFKEVPFFFMRDNDPEWLTLKKEFGISDEFPFNQLVHRAVTDRKRSIYLVSKKVRDFILSNKEEVDRSEFVKMINCGMKLFFKAESEAGFRICQDGVAEVFPYIHHHLKVTIDKNDLVNLLKARNLPITDLSDSARVHIESFVKQGSFIMVYKHTEEDTDEQSTIPLVAWRGFSSVTLYVSNTYRIHLCALTQLKIGGLQQGIVIAGDPKLSSDAQQAEQNVADNDEGGTSTEEQ